MTKGHPSSRTTIIRRRAGLYHSHSVAMSSQGEHEAMAWMKLGQVKIARAIESNGPFMSIYDFFPDATPEMLAPHRHWLEPAAVEPGTNLLVMPIQSYIIRTPQHVVLVDSCVGKHKSVPWFRTWDQMSGDTYLPALAALGLQPQDIDLVLCTHLQVDHLCWKRAADSRGRSGSAGRRPWRGCGDHGRSDPQSNPVPLPALELPLRRQPAARRLDLSQLP